MKFTFPDRYGQEWRAEVWTEIYDIHDSQCLTEFGEHRDWAPLVTVHVDIDPPPVKEIDCTITVNDS